MKNYNISMNKENEKKIEKPVEVSDIIVITIANLISKAWAYLGAISHPETGEIKEDTAQAKLAIDAIDNLFVLVKDKMEEKERKEIEISLANLRLNFVKEK